MTMMTWQKKNDNVEQHVAELKNIVNTCLAKR